MTRNKSRSDKVAVQAFPHIIEVAVPPGGLGEQLSEMHAWHLERGIQSRTRRVHRDGQDYVRWLFATASKASAFKERFGGEIA